MKLLTLLFFLCLIFELKCDDNTLVFVHVIFRHGERTPDETSLYQTSPYMNESYYKPYGFGQLTNKGKLTAYILGKDLRKRYSGFLDEEYNIKLIDARSSSYNRTKASLEAMLAGLFPPSKDLIWLEGLNWQPIPYDYVEPGLDKELFCFGCQKWLEDFLAQINSNDGKQLLSQYQDTFDIIRENTGENYDLMRSYTLYFVFEYLEEQGYTLPSWVSSVYPYPLKDMLMVFYDSILRTKYLRQMATGYLLKKILSDVHEKIDGQIPEKKMSIWCGHETNIAPLLMTLNVYDRKEPPACGSSILMELHFIDQEYGFKIYYNNKQSAHELLRVPGCGEFCPLDQFEALMIENIPESDNMCGKASSASGSSRINWTIAIFYSIYTLNIFRIEWSQCSID